MIGKTIKIGTGMVVALTAGMLAFPNSAFADYAPTSNDVVGVGSDTLQQLGDFVADGDFTGNVGYNSTGNKNKFISIDATADANTRLAYGPQGLGPNCAPGNGGTAGTGNQNGLHADAPCTLNPTVQLRAGRTPTQRPNGSGAGYNLLKADTNAGGTGLGYVDFARASSPRGSNTLFDSVTVGTDPLAMLSSTTTNAVALSATMLTGIYNCTITTWNDPAIGGTSSATIKPLLPQVGSGTRSSFLAAIGNPTPGSCVTNVEENDPEAIDASGDSVNAIEPMSGGRLNLFLGKLSDGTSNGVGGYFKDPSCPFPPAESTTPAGCLTAGAALTPNVKYWNTGTPSSGTLFNPTRNLYIYFRHADINSTKKFQPGGSLNWVSTMLYNPCPTPGSPSCVTIGGVEYGPGGAPYVASATGQANISASGITPFYAYNLAGP
jgi:ABC-type phosphate transport system substrate-binding protein